MIKLTVNMSSNAAATAFYSDLLQVRKSGRVIKGGQGSAVEIQEVIAFCSAPEEAESVRLLLERRRESLERIERMFDDELDQLAEKSK